MVIKEVQINLYMENLPRPQKVNADLEERAIKLEEQITNVQRMIIAKTEDEIIAT